MLLPTAVLHRVHLVEKEKAEQKTKLLEKKLADANELTPYMNTKGQEDTLGSFMIKVRINSDHFRKKQGLYYFVLLQEIIGSFECFVGPRPEEGERKQCSMGDWTAL